MKGPLTRLVGGLGLLVMISLLVVFATTSAFAFTVGTDQPNTANANGPANGSGSLSALTLRAASAETFSAAFTYASTTFATNQQIDAMYQQWRHNQQNDWFYLYARNINDNDGITTFGSAAQPVFAHFYYSPGQGAVQIATGIANMATALNPSNALAVGTIYLHSGTTNNPAFIIDSVQAGVIDCSTAGAGQATCTASLNTTLRWGVAQQGFRGGSMSLLQAVESAPIRTASISDRTVYYDAWESPFGATAANVTLSNAAPTQAADGVTNASGTRQSNLAATYNMRQTVGDINGDVNMQSIIWVFSSGADAGKWWEAGSILNRLNNGEDIDLVTPSSTGFYQDWQTAASYFTAGTANTVGYFTSLTVSDVDDNSAGIAAASGDKYASTTVQYTFIYGSAARGSVTVWGTAGDWHGGFSGNVQVGTQTIT